MRYSIDELLWFFYWIFWYNKIEKIFNVNGYICSM